MAGGVRPAGRFSLRPQPVYGQGMSVAAMQAARPPDTAGLVGSLARTARLPWFAATAEDAVVRGVQGALDPGFLGRLAGRYLDEIHLNAARDRQTLRRFTEVSQLVRPPIALLDPVVAWRVARGAASRVARSARPGSRRLQRGRGASTRDTIGLT